jgi:hypothetical protein
MKGIQTAVVKYYMIKEGGWEGYREHCKEALERAKSML